MQVVDQDSVNMLADSSMAHSNPGSVHDTSYFKGSIAFAQSS